MIKVSIDEKHEKMIPKPETMSSWSRDNCCFDCD